MKEHQERKYDAVWFDADGNEMAIPPDHEIRLVNRVSREAIPDDEPVFIFRARDVHAAEMLGEYWRRVNDQIHQVAVAARHDDFLGFKAAHPLRMKEPDTDLQL